MILGLRTVIYPASYLAAVAAWYTELLEQVPYLGQSFYVGFAVEGFELGLLPDAKPGTIGPQPLWGVDDIESTFKRLLDSAPPNWSRWSKSAKAPRCRRTVPRSECNTIFLPTRKTACSSRSGPAASFLKEHGRVESLQ